MDGRRSDSGEICLDDEELVELDGSMEVALDPDARQPDPERFDEIPVGQSGRPKHLRLGQSEEPQVRLVVDDAGGVDVFPADVLLDAVACQRRLLSRRRGGKPEVTGARAEPA